MFPMCYQPQPVPIIFLNFGNFLTLSSSENGSYKGTVNNKLYQTIPHLQIL